MRVKFDSGLKQKKCVWYAHLLLLLISIVFQGIQAVTLGTNSNPPVRSTVQYSFPTAVYNAIEGFGWADGGFSFADSLTTCTFNSFFPVNGPVALSWGRFDMLLDANFDNGVDITSTGTIRGNGYTIYFENRDNPYKIPSATNARPLILNNVALDFGASVTLGQTIFFQGNCILDCEGNSCDLGDYSIIVDSNSYLLLENMTIKSLGRNQYNLRCLDNTGTFSLSNVRLVFDNNFTFSLGSMDIIGDLMFTGTYIFSYLSTKTMTIRANSQVIFDMGMTFSYNPSNSLSYLINMENRFSTLYLNQAYLYAGPGGLRLTKGTLTVDGQCPVASSGGIWLGGGTSASNMYLNILPESGFTVTAGYLIQNNV